MTIAAAANGIVDTTAMIQAILNVLAAANIRASDADVLAMTQAILNALQVVGTVASTKARVRSRKMIRVRNRKAATKARDQSEIKVAHPTHHLQVQVHPPHRQHPHQRHILPLVQTQIKLLQVQLDIPTGHCLKWFSSKTFCSKDYHSKRVTLLNGQYSERSLLVF